MTGGHYSRCLCRWQKKMDKYLSRWKVMFDCLDTDGSGSIEAPSLGTLSTQYLAYPEHLSECECPQYAEYPSVPTVPSAHAPPRRSPECAVRACVLYALLAQHVPLTEKTTTQRKGRVAVRRFWSSFR
jgi:hypothetical protein